MDNFDSTISPEELLGRYSALVYRLAYARTQNVHDAQDITQEVFLRYIKKDRVFLSEEHRKAWFIRVTVNAGKSLVTSAWFRHRAAEDAEPEDARTSEITEESAVGAAVEALPPKYREVVHLFYFEELSVAQIAAALPAKESTVKSLLHRARALLKESLKEEQYEL